MGIIPIILTINLLHQLLVTFSFLKSIEYLKKKRATLLFRSSSKMQGDNLNTSARRFQVGIHFNLGYTKPKTLFSH